MQILIDIHFVSDFLAANPGGAVTLHGWLRNRRRQGKIIFLDIIDSTGSMQAVVERSAVSEEEFDLASKTRLESGISVSGTLISRANCPNEVHANSFAVIGEATLRLDPQPRSDFDPFDERITRQMLDYRHIYLRNPKVMAILQFRRCALRVLDGHHHKTGLMRYASSPLRQANHQVELFVLLSFERTPFVDLLQGNQHGSLSNKKVDVSDIEYGKNTTI